MKARFSGPLLSIGFVGTTAPCPKAYNAGVDVDEEPLDPRLQEDLAELPHDQRGNHSDGEVLDDLRVRRPSAAGPGVQLYQTRTHKYACVETGRHGCGGGAA